MTYSFSEAVRKLNPGLEKITTSVPASKYHNARTESKGLRFQSGREASEVMKLIRAEEQHQVYALRLQVKFPLQGENSYTADAVYLDENLEVHIVDVKGYKTKEFKIKAKLFAEKYGQEIELI